MEDACGGRIRKFYHSDYVDSAAVLDGCVRCEHLKARYEQALLESSEVQAVAGTADSASLVVAEGCLHKTCHPLRFALYVNYYLLVREDKTTKSRSSAHVQTECYLWRAVLRRPPYSDSARLSGSVPCNGTTLRCGIFIFLTTRE